MNCDTVAAISSSSCNYIFGKNSDRHKGEIQLVEHFDRQTNLLQESFIATHKTKIPVSQLAQRCFAQIQPMPWKNDTSSSSSSSFSEKYFSTSLRHVISRPHHMFGAEMGFNENGVTIGNEAVFCPPKIPSSKHVFGANDDDESFVENDEIIGMDALRLAITFAPDAWFACSIIAALVEFFGDDENNDSSLKKGFRGDCGDGNGAVEYYHNAFLICDPERILRMFCLGEHWCVCNADDQESLSSSPPAQQPQWNVTSISNFLPFGITKSKIIACSSKFYEFAKFLHHNDPGDSRCLRTNIFSSSPPWFKVMDYFANGSQRECVTKCLLDEGLNNSDIKKTKNENPESLFCFSKMASSLRAHGSAAEDSKNRIEKQQQEASSSAPSSSGEIGLPLSELSSLTQISVCMHAGVGPVKMNQTANSLIVIVEKSSNHQDQSRIKIRAFSTEAPNPCVSVFTPILFRSEGEDDMHSSRNRFLGITNPRQCTTFTETTKSKRRWSQFEEIIRRCTILGVEKYLNRFATECRQLESELLSKENMMNFEVFCGDEATKRSQEINEKVLDLLHNWWNITGTALLLPSSKTKKDEGTIISLYQWLLKK